MSLSDIQHVSNVNGQDGLFESVLVFENYPLDLSDLNHRVDNQPRFYDIQGLEQNHLPLNLVIYPGDEVQVKLAFRRENYPAQYVQCALERYVRILRSLCEETALSDVSMLTKEERNRALIEWNNSAMDYPSNLSLYDAFVQRVGSSPQQSAIVHKNTHLNYQELNERIKAISEVLVERGVVSGNRVAVSLEKSPDAVAAMLSVMCLGAVYVPVAPDCPADRRNFIVQDARITHTITTSDCARNLDGGTKNTSLENGHTCQTNVVCVDQIVPSQSDFTVVNYNVDSESEAYVIYTSGTTGTPKGVAISHRSLVNLCFSCYADKWIKPGEAALQFAPHTFDASMAEIFVCLLVGGELNIAHEEVINDPEKMQEFLTSRSIRLAAFPPQYLQQLDPASLPSDLTILTAGSSPTLSLVNAWGETHRYFNAYGPTETTVLSSAWEYDRNAVSNGKLPMGKPLANTEIYIVDHFNQLCAPGQKGEICIGGHGVSLGYLNRPDLNESQFVANDWGINCANTVYRTGDLGRWLDDGSVEFLGRCDNQLKIRGFRVEPEEIENCIVQVSAVQQCAVLAKPDRFGDLRLIAYLESSGSDESVKGEVKAKIESTLPHYMMPSHIVVLPEFAMTVNGKIDRNALQNLDVSSAHEKTVSQDVISSQEQSMLEIWKDALSNDNLIVTDDFFDAGGNSILLLRMMKPMHDAGFVISVNDFYQRRTVRKCCELFGTTLEAVIDTWHEGGVEISAVSHVENHERTDFWVINPNTIGIGELKAGLEKMDADSLPDFIHFAENPKETGVQFESVGKQALPNWNRPYNRTILDKLNSELERFDSQFCSTDYSGSVEFTPMQEVMTNWAERTVFELISVSGWFEEAQLNKAYLDMAKKHQLLHALPYKNRRWKLLDKDTLNCDIPYLDLRYLDFKEQNSLIKNVIADLQKWQEQSDMPYTVCWVSMSDTKHYFLMVNDHLISDESSSIAIKSHLDQALRNSTEESDRQFSSYLNQLEPGLNVENVDFVEELIDTSKIEEVNSRTELSLQERSKKPLQRALIRVPLNNKASPLDQSFDIFRKFVRHLIREDEFCMVLNHFGRQLGGENDFHQIGLFLDKIPFAINETTKLSDVNATVRALENKGVNFVGLVERGMLTRQNCMPQLNSEVLFNYQGDQAKDPLVQEWFSGLNIKKQLKMFNGIVFEARQSERELSIHFIFRGKKGEIDSLLGMISGARLAEYSLADKKTQQQRIKGKARDGLYKQLIWQSTDMEKAIQLSNVKKQYGDFEAVKGVSFSVDKGTCFGILGPNGAGKTTLLGMIEGVEDISSGSIKILDFDIETELKKIQPHIGVQLQQNNYFQFLTVEEMLKFYRDFRAASSGTHKGLSIEELLDKLSLSDKRTALVDELSGGQKQRLTIAIALLEDPDIVFLDEPTSALDPQNRRYTWEFIEQLKESGDKTIILTTHYMEEAERLCDEILILNEGQVIAQGTPDELIESLNAHYDISVLLGKGDVNDKAIKAMTGVKAISWGLSKQDLTISTTESTSTLKELLEYSESSGIDLLQLNINRPSLEDVFLSSTGKELRE